MEIRDLKKNIHKTVRINDEILRVLELSGYTIQQFLDAKLSEFILVSDPKIKVKK